MTLRVEPTLDLSYTIPDLHRITTLDKFNLIAMIFAFTTFSTGTSRLIPCYYQGYTKCEIKL